MNSLVTLGKAELACCQDFLPSDALPDPATSTKLHLVQKGKLSHRIKEASGTWAWEEWCFGQCGKVVEDKQERDLLTTLNFCEEAINRRCCMGQFPWFHWRLLFLKGGRINASCPKLCLVVGKGKQEQHSNIFWKRIWKYGRIWTPTKAAMLSIKHVTPDVKVPTDGTEVEWRWWGMTTCSECTHSLRYDKAEFW